jgi:hypothetical protein
LQGRYSLYTKIVLTAIAVALIALSIRSLKEPTQVLAQGPTRVIIAGIDGQQQGLQRGLPVYLYASNPQQQALPVNLSQLAGGHAQTLPVTVVGTGANVLVPVKLLAIGQNGTTAVPVNVVQVGGNAVDKKGVPVVDTNKLDGATAKPEK